MLLNARTFLEWRLVKPWIAVWAYVCLPKLPVGSTTKSLTFHMGVLSNGQLDRVEGYYGGYLMARIDGAPAGPVCDDDFNARTGENVCR